jgi:hypothetical protein
MSDVFQPEAGLPKARGEGLIVRELDGELLVYDGKRDTASALNGFAARVWRACDGASDARAIAAALSTAASHVEPEAVTRALATLRQAHLLETAGDAATSGRSRRQALLAVAAGAATVAVVTTIAAPAAAAAISCVANGGACGSNGDCCSLFCDGTNHCAIPT